MKKLDDKIARTTAKFLLEINAIHFNSVSPFILTSGLKSPVYVDCRRIISYAKEREIILNKAISYFKKLNLSFDVLAGGETAGIPYAAFLSEKLKIPSMNGYGLEVIDYLPPGRNI